MYIYTKYIYSKSYFFAKNGILSYGYPARIIRLSYDFISTLAIAITQREFLGYDPTLYIRSQRLEELTSDINNFLFIPSNEILRKDTSFF